MPHAVKGASWTVLEDTLHTWILAHLKVQDGHQMDQLCQRLRHSRERARVCDNSARSADAVLD